MHPASLLFGAITAGALLGVTPVRDGHPAHASGHTPTLLKHHRRLLALARARGESEVTLVVASHVGDNSLVAQEVERLGGRVLFRADEVDYLRIGLPLRQVERFARFAFVERVDIDVDGYRIEPLRPEGIAALRREEPSDTPPASDMPLRRPYRPATDIGAERLWAVHPFFDGRGVGVAMVDLMPDVLLPAFQHARALDGRVVPKIPTILTVVDPRNDNDCKWVAMDAVIRVIGGHFSYGGITYIAPADGVFRFGRLDGRALRWYEAIEPYVVLNGSAEGNGGLFPVLWDERSGTVWVDTNQNQSFADEHPMMDYAVRRDTGVIGRDLPGTPRRESVGFTIQTDRSAKAVRITLGVGWHATAVAAAALGLEVNGPLRAIASEAQLIPVDEGFFPHHLIDAAVVAARSGTVDVLCLTPMFVAVDVNPVADGHQVAGIVLERLVARYQKLIFMPAGNAQGLGTVLDRAAGQAVIAVGAYQSAESYRTNYGTWVGREDNLHWAGSSGPAGDGGLKPEILSPAGVLTAYPGFLPSAKRKGVYELPPGYQIGGGTSTAAPTATAAAAVLISAAKQRGIRYDAVRLRTALLSTARFLPGVPAYQQGNGLVQVDAAWELLQALNQKFEPLDLESRAPVRTQVSDYLARPNEGRGIYEREGWQPGQQRTRIIHFIRRAGPRSTVTVHLEWVGNDGTFETQAALALPLDSSVALPVRIRPTTAGVHSTILNLRRQGYPGIMYQLLNTIVAADDLGPENGYSVERNVRVERPGTRSLFLHVPPRTKALHVEVEIPNAESTLSVRALPPDRAYREGDRSDILGVTEHGWLNRLISNPVPGVWEILLTGNNFGANPEEMDSRPLTAVPASVRVSAVGVVRSASEGARLVGFRNLMAPSWLRAMSWVLGSARAVAGTISEGKRQMYDINVPPGIAALRVKSAGAVRNLPGVDLDIYLFEVINGVAMLRAQGNSSSSNEEVTVDNPQPGIWRVVVDGFRVPGESAPYRYEDVLFSARFGRLVVQDTQAIRRLGAQWRVPVRVVLGRDRPVGGRRLVGYVPVVIASGDQKPGPSRPSVPSSSAVFYATTGSSHALAPVGESRVTVP
jgi:hypothetical protein